MEFEIIRRGFVFECKPGTAAATAAGPRCVRTNSGDLLCSFVVQTALGTNDFVVMLARSKDGGDTWLEPQPLWPHLSARQSLFASISRSPSGDLFIYGITIPIDRPGESFWSDATQGMKANSLFWARSTDNGLTWTEPTAIPLPCAGAAEAAGPICVTRKGAWLACFAPYNTFDPAVKVKRDVVIALRSEDQGATWSAQPMMSFADPKTGGAEAWIVELADGKLLGACWNIHLEGGEDPPNPYVLSSDDGRSWHPLQSTGIRCQTTALLPLPDGRVLMPYNQRKHGEPGVWIATARPTLEDFGVESNQIVWRAATRTQSGTAGDYEQWTDFSFGEPSVTRLSEDQFLLFLWCQQPSAKGILYVKLGANQ